MVVLFFFFPNGEFRAWRERFRREPLVILPDYDDSESEVSIPIDCNPYPIDLHKYFNDESDPEIGSSDGDWERRRLCQQFVSYRMGPGLRSFFS